MFTIYLILVLGWMVYSSHTPKEWQEILDKVEE